MRSSPVSTATCAVARARLLLTACAAAMTLGACGAADAPTPTAPDSGSGNGNGTATTPPVAPPLAFPGIAAALTIDVTALPNYAAPAYPVHYDTRVLRQDNAGANAVTDIGATLGRVLFFDRRLSINNTVSCASCHQQADGFTDRARLSVGFDGVRRTGMHSMRLANARFHAEPGFFWDRRAATLEVQSTEPIRDSLEMGFDARAGGIDSLVRRMHTLPYYPELFRLAFGDSAITEPRLQRALAMYMRSIVSIGSRWDAGYAQVYSAALPDNGLDLPVPGLTAQEDRGRQLFMRGPGQGGAGCASCHVPPAYALAPNARGNGLDAGESIVFKSPSLKNAAVAGPYMHDGRFTTLDQVVAHYNSGVRLGPALDQRLRNGNGGALRLNLSAADRQALVAFMGTLTDTQLLSDPKFGDPFRR